jgi:hypothetical protein
VRALVATHNKLIRERTTAPENPTAKSMHKKQNQTQDIKSIVYI